MLGTHAGIGIEHPALGSPCWHQKVIMAESGPSTPEREQLTHVPQNRHQGSSNQPARVGPLG